MSMTTIKEKLKNNMSLVLKYQMITGKSLMDIPPILSMESLENEIKRTLKKDTKNKSNDLEITEDIISKEKFMQYKNLRQLKYITEQIDSERLTITVEYYDDQLNEHSDALNKDINLIDYLIDNKLLLANSRITVELFNCFSSDTVKYYLNIIIKMSCKNNKRIINYLKKNIKSALNYSLSMNVPLSSLLNNLESLKNIDNEYVSQSTKCEYSKNLKLKNLYAINSDNLKNNKVELRVLNKDFDTIHSGIYYDINTALEDLNNILNDNNHIYKITRDNVSLTKYTINDDIRYDTLIGVMLKELITEDHDDSIICEDELNVLDGFNNYTFTHGLCAFNDYYNLSDRINTLINNDITICCGWNKQYIGPYGVYVQGKCIMASLYDLGSYVDDTNGKRYIDKLDYTPSGKITSPKEIILTNTVNGEALVKDYKITGIWIRKSYLNVYKDDITVLKNNLNINKMSIINDFNNSSLIYNGNNINEVIINE